MARALYEPKQIYTGDGSLATYTFDFKLELIAQLEVVVVNQFDVEVQRVRGNDTSFLDSVTLNSQTIGGGTVVLKANLPASYRMILLEANDAPTQPYEFGDKKTFSLKTFERALDFIVGQTQRLAFRAKQSFRIHDLDDENSFDAQLPPGIQDPDNYDRTFAINDDGTGLKLGPTTAVINGAVGAAEAAIAAATAAGLSEENAAESEENAAVSEANTTFYANLFLFQEFIKVTPAESPVSVNANGNLYLADDAAGDIDFLLPPLGTVDVNWKTAVIKQSASANVLNVIPSGSDTILNNPTFQAQDKGIGCVFFKDTETNWSIRYFAFTESTGMSSLPNGGAEGAALVKNSAIDQDCVFDDLEFTGFSARFNTNWQSNGLRDTLEKILNITYLGPLIASFSGSSNVLREKGATVASITLSVDVTKRSNPINRIRFLQGATEIVDYAPPSQIGSGVTTAPYNTPFSDNRTFTVQVTDQADASGGPTTVSANVSYSFIYPYYSGAANPGISAAVVATLSKLIISSTATLNRSFTTANGNVYYFAYPAAYGVLTSILDENGFEVFGSFTRRTENITGLDGNAISYYIYESNNPVVAGTTNFTFKR